MRMWMIDPELLCDKHLLGEHSEIHKHKHNFEKQHKIDGRMNPIVQIVPSEMKIRHDILAYEMICRKFKHESPYEMPDISYLTEEYLHAKVDIEYNIKDLSNRCPECRKRIENERT